MGVDIWAYLPVAVLLIVTPGPDTVLVTKNAMIHGRSAALGTALGVNAGLMTWTIAAALGVAALVRESALAFTALKLVGAAYLIWLGVQAFRTAEHAPTVARSVGARRGRLGAGGGFRQGLISNVANPKIAVFFTSLLPQFVSQDEPVLAPFLLLGSLFVLMTLVWLVAYALLAARASAVLTRPRVKAALDRMAGVVLIGLGVRLATERAASCNLRSARCSGQRLASAGRRQLASRRARRLVWAIG